MFKDVLSNLLADAKNKNVPAAKIAENLGVARSMLTHWKTGRSFPTEADLKKLASYFNVSVDYLLKDDLPGAIILDEPHILPVYSSIRAGNGDTGITDGEKEGSIFISDEYAKMKVFAMRVSGDSMMNELFDGEIAIFKPINGDPIRNKDIYAIEVESWGQWVIKFIHHDSSGTVQLISANKQYPVKEINPAVQNVILRGKLIESRRIRK
ncbi:MAG: XRE family transcriptional regulator [Candidatus Riflebacteria bacterium]|nr:XRE family transcriptional regulator [Candidatus Riflebacteria bacterium]